MNNTMTKIATGLGLLLCLAACGSSPANHFYRLTPGPGAIGEGQQPALGIGPVEIPEFLKRNTLVYSKGDNRLQIAGGELWAEPLDEGVKRVVGLNLAQLLDTGNLSYFPWDTRHNPTYGIRVTVLDLDANDGQATLVADWRLYRPEDGKTVDQRISQFSQTLGTGNLAASELPAAYSALFYQLSETIAAAVRSDQHKQAAGERTPPGS